MVVNIVNKMNELIRELKTSILEDIEDIKLAKHEDLLKRNDEKHRLIDEISNLKIDLNKELVSQMEQGVDVNIFRSKVDELEVELKELYKLNKKLASIVLPVQQMYKDLVEEISIANGGNAFDVKA
ncbi:hypothetical protein GCM10012288_08220 [Malaciobacter pacificus]|jgi:hypothetical protein|uniref:Uncharacterized protein n=1 Tax=Malaciobacter pacificus TaxID=1080223 RepID=A0A5C2H860_9BACT|nr:hypothetical protein [Malaciobacter pacificus]QEP35127.1 hypothetical protein APAC_2055 [Malaciobacter pacificus]GGD36544.1 hypothetical protein GCM10012288_08220 [Malaciobacter pacificus]